MVLFMVASFAKAAYVQRDSWSWLNSNARALTGNECGLANDVLVEADVNTGMLAPAAVDGRPAPSISDALAGAGQGSSAVGFTPNGVANKLSVDATEDTDSSGSSGAVSSAPTNSAPTGAGSCLLYTSPSPRDLSTSRMPSSA